MKYRKIIISTLLLCLVVLPSVSAVAQSARKDKETNKIWSNRQGRNGLYVRNMDAQPGGVTFSLDGLYYFGDIEEAKPLAAFTDFSPANIGISGTFSYLQPIHRIVKMRYSLGGGLLRAEDKSDRTFNSWFGKVGVGAECHPLPLDYNFYVYGGAAFNLGFIDFNYGGITNGDARYVTYNPQLSLEVGYNFQLEHNWFLGIHIGSDFNVVDAPHMSLDARPSFESAPYNPSLGEMWSDGYIYIGLTVTYDWSNHSRGRLLLK